MGVTALDPEGLEHVAKNNAMMGRSTGRFMMSVALDACIAINFAYMTWKISAKAFIGLDHVAIRRWHRGFFGDYVAGGALDPASLSEYQRRVAAAVQAHSINMESDFAVLSGIVDRHGGQKGEVTVPMLMAKLNVFRHGIHRCDGGREEGHGRAGAEGH